MARTLRFTLIASLATIVSVQQPLALLPAHAQSQNTLRKIYKPALPGGLVRTYYVAAEEVNWDYAPSGQDEMMGHSFMDNAKPYVERAQGRIGRVHRKAVYFEYVDDKFSARKPRPPEWAHAGILGPILRAEVGDVIRVIFKNMTSRPVSLHPHGVFYLKADEGAPSNDGTSGAEKRDDAVDAGDVQIYVWQVPERAGPAPRDPSSVVWLYHSHTDRVRDTNAGLIGAIIVTRRGMAGSNLKPRDVDREFITLWKIFDENRSPYIVEDTHRAGGDHASLGLDRSFRESNRKNTVNRQPAFGDDADKHRRARALVHDRARWRSRYSHAALARQHGHCRRSACRCRAPSASSACCRRYGAGQPGYLDDPLSCRRAFGCWHERSLSGAAARHDKCNTTAFRTPALSGHASDDDDAPVPCLTFRLDMDQHLGAPHLLANRLFQPIANPMCFGYAHSAGHDQMKFDERRSSGAARAQVVRLEGARRILRDDLADTSSDVGGDRLVHQPAHRLTGEPPAGIENVGRDGGGQCGIEQLPARDRRQDEAGDDAG